MPPAEEFAVLVEVDEVYEQLVADGANETGRMPHAILTCAWRAYADVASVDIAGTLKYKRKQFIDVVNHKLAQW